MQDFLQWLSERGARSDMHNRLHMLPPNAQTPIRADAPLVLKHWSKKQGRCDDLSPAMKKETGCKGKEKKGSNPWKDSFSKVESSSPA